MYKKIVLAALLATALSLPHQTAHAKNEPMPLVHHLFMHSVLNFEAIAEAYAIHTIDSTDAKTIERSSYVTSVAQSLALVRSALLTIAVGHDAYENLNLPAHDNKELEKRFDLITPIGSVSIQKKEACLIPSCVAGVAGTASGVYSLYKDAQIRKNADRIAKRNSLYQVSWRREKINQYLDLIGRLLVQCTVISGIRIAIEKDKASGEQEWLVKCIPGLAYLVGTLFEWNRKANRYQLMLAGLDDIEMNEEEGVELP